MVVGRFHSLVGAIAVAQKKDFAGVERGLQKQLDLPLDGFHQLSTAGLFELFLIDATFGGFGCLRTARVDA